MSKTLKAVLFSAFVFPGSGHLYLRKPVQGSLLIAVSIACITILLFVAVDKAQQISAKILSGEIPLDVTRIIEEITKHAATNGAQWADISTYLLLICWLIGIVDSFRVGRLRGKVDTSIDQEI
jgi:TM2 domain-containing membrane protein YozV